MHLCIVIPVFNEAENLSALLQEWQEAVEKVTSDFRFLVVNDGSTDRSLAILQSLQKQFSRMTILNQPNSGHGAACRLGYTVACSEDCTWVLQIDSDRQCNPDYFEKFWNLRMHADYILGNRIYRGDGLLRHIISFICRIGVFVITGIDGRDLNVPYRLVRKTVLRKTLEAIPETFEMQNIALTVMLRKNPFLKGVYIPIRFLKRQTGKSSLHLANTFRMGWRMLRALRAL